MATSNSTTEATCNDVAYVSANQLADSAMFITSAMRLIGNTDGEAYCLLEMARNEIISAQDYLEGMDPVKSPISADVAEMLVRVGSVTGNEMRGKTKKK